MNEEEKNSIEKVENLIKRCDECKLKECINCETNYTEITSIKKIVDSYKRLLKEDETLKKEKEQAWEEWNNLEQGSYETEQKLKQQIKELQKENEELKNKIMEKELEIIGKEEYTKASMGEIIEQYYTANEECIPVQKVKDKIEEIVEKIKHEENEKVVIYLSKQKNILQELLESEE